MAIRMGKRRTRPAPAPKPAEPAGTTKPTQKEDMSEHEKMSLQWLASYNEPVCCTTTVYIRHMPMFVQRKLARHHGGHIYEATDAGRKLAKELGA